MTRQRPPDEVTSARTSSNTSAFSSSVSFSQKSGGGRPQSSGKGSLRSRGHSLAESVEPTLLVAVPLSTKTCHSPPFEQRNLTVAEGTNAHETARSAPLRRLPLPSTRSCGSSCRKGQSGRHRSRRGVHTPSMQVAWSINAAVSLPSGRSSEPSSPLLLLVAGEKPEAQVANARAPCTAEELSGAAPSPGSRKAYSGLAAKGGQLSKQCSVGFVHAPSWHLNSPLATASSPRSPPAVRQRTSTTLPWPWRLAALCSSTLPGATDRTVEPAGGSWPRRAKRCSSGLVSFRCGQLRSQTSGKALHSPSVQRTATAAPGTRP
mmetsp:Transcript_100071/g.283434  ORF Transcript_100071/g.283434 Transcript_100071/m.283434 type:complete len:319 (+) Transcript_100071:152-1108(+)